MRSFGKNINNSLGGVFDATSRLVTRVGRDTISYVTLGGAVGIDYLYSGQINPLLLACAGIYEIRRAAHQLLSTNGPRLVGDRSAPVDASQRAHAAGAGSSFAFGLSGLDYSAFNETYTGLTLAAAGALAITAFVKNAGGLCEAGRAYSQFMWNKWGDNDTGGGTPKQLQLVRAHAPSPQRGRTHRTLHS
jgi:hypothetical protein